ncbi:OmpA family protein [Rhodococcus sp. ACS1]|uniref:OmpA family protein n=1 Tax=Rhodococcus sp. ACS1 TaxID=2028570 RepID=UPI0015CD26FF|nr:OmpA family protein [Rhodococcus sp. ACS1]
MEFTRRHCVVLAFVILGVGILSACAPVRAVPRTVTLIATATTAEPRPSLPDSLRTDLMRLAKSSKKAGQATVRLITSPDAPVIERDLTPLRPTNGGVQHAAADADRQIRDALGGVDELLRNSTANTPGLDVLSLLDRASQMPDSDINVLSSGASTEDPVAFQQIGFDFDPVSVIDRIEQGGGLPNLSGHVVAFHHLGITAGSQPRLQPFERQAIETFWLQLCQRAHADSCAIAKDESVTEPPIATLPVPVIPVTTIATEGGCPVWQRLGDDTLHFRPDSAVLPSDADGFLIKIVADARACKLRVSITGHIADTGNGDRHDLAGQRARAVSSRLAALGLPTDALGTVEGRGTSEPVISNFTNRQFDEAKARLNRRVELTFHRSMGK